MAAIKKTTTHQYSPLTITLSQQRPVLLGGSWETRARLQQQDQDGFSRPAVYRKVQFILLLSLLAISIRAAVPQAIYRSAC